MTEPWRVFRYRPVTSFLWQELELHEWYCAPREALNDVFDARINWRGSIERALAEEAVDDARRSQLRVIQALFESRKPDPVGNVGICCFSAKADDPLMWAHYADANRGVCLLYEVPGEYLWTKYTAEKSDFFLVGGSPVVYGDNPFFDWLVSGDLDGPPVGDAAANAVTKLLSTKASQWAHEEESRLITSKPGKIVIEPEFLTQVIFGIETTEAHQRLIKLAARRANSSVKISAVERSKNSDFGLDFPDIED